MKRLKRLMLIRKIMTLIVLTYLISGCVSQQGEVQTNIVRQKLQTYHVNKTRFEDFKNDAGLIAIGNSYGIPTNSAWRLIQTENSMKIIDGKLFHRWIYTVGDNNGPICKLSFDTGGNLTDLSYVTETSAFLPADQADDDAIDNVIKKLESSYRAGDYSYSCEILYSPILHAMGGKEAMIKATEVLKAEMREKQIKIISWKPKRPYKYIAGEMYNFGGKMYAIIPYESLMQVGEKAVLQQGYLLGIKTTINANWQFVNGDQLNPETYQKFFPDFPKTIKLPETKKIFE